MNQAAYASRRIAFRVEYDGTGYSGWQKQLNTPTTIQQSLEEAWSAFVGHDVTIQGASRTDAGVHALGQTFSCAWPEKVPLEKLQRAVNKLLEPEIRIESLDQVPDDFHARFSATVVFA